jgi:hypothetical protein
VCAQRRQRTTSGGRHSSVLLAGAVSRAWGSRRATGSPDDTTGTPAAMLHLRTLPDPLVSSGGAIR